MSWKNGGVNVVRSQDHGLDSMLVKPPETQESQSMFFGHTLVFDRVLGLWEVAVDINPNNILCKITVFLLVDVDFKYLSFFFYSYETEMFRISLPIYPGYRSERMYSGQSCSSLSQNALE